MLTPLKENIFLFQKETFYIYKSLVIQSIGLELELLCRDRDLQEQNIQNIFGNFDL